MLRPFWDSPGCDSDGVQRLTDVGNLGLPYKQPLNQKAYFTLVTFFSVPFKSDAWPSLKLVYSEPLLLLHYYT